LVTIPIVHGFFVMMALIGAMSFLPLFVQAVIGTSAAEAGRVLTPLILPWVTASIIGGRLILKFGYRPLAFIGMASMLIGSVLLTMVSVETTRLQLSINVAFLGIGGGLTVATLMLAAQHAVPRAEMGVTTAAVQFFRSIGAAFGTGTMGALMNWSLHKSLAGATGELARFANQSELTSIVRPETRASLSPAAASFLQHALARSLRTAFFFVLATIIISSVISLLIPGGDAHQLAHSEHQPAELDEDTTAVVAEI
jgi:MFS family permease